jgi:hypothetical protein
LGEFVKDKVYFPPLPVNVDDPWVGIAGAVAEVTPDLLCCTWEEIHCRWDICDTTSGSHIDL